MKTIGTQPSVLAGLAYWMDLLNTIVQTTPTHRKPFHSTATALGCFKSALLSDGHHKEKRLQFVAIMFEIFWWRLALLGTFHGGL